MSCYALLVIRRSYLLAPSAIVFALLACGGANDSGLFSGGGASAGTQSSTAGAPASAGAAAAPPTEGGASTAGGSSDGAGQASGGSASGSAGSNAAGAETGGSAGSVQAGAGGSAAGSAGSSTAGTGTGGSSAGSGGAANTAGSGGSSAGSAGAGGGQPTCQDLIAQAASQLEAARACNLARNVEQCTGKVKTTCNCEVPVENQNSAETQAYEATLKQINQKKCVQICPAIACTPVNRAQCRASNVGSSAGTCIASFGPTPL